MRMIVMFDLPVTTANDRRNYRKFRQFLIKEGFFMMQESVYCKLAPNAVSMDLIIERIQKNKPPDGLVQVLKITEKQFSKIEYIVGERVHEVLDTDERLVIL